MNYEEMTRRIDKNDGNILRNMIQNKVLPEDVLTEYFRIKTVLDRVSAAFTPFGLAMVVLNCEQPEPLGEFKTMEEKVAEEIPKEEADKSKPELKSKDETTDKTPVDYVPAVPDTEEMEKWPEGAFKKGVKVSFFSSRGAITDGEVVSAYYSDPADAETLTYQIEVEGQGDPEAILADDVELKEG